MLLFVSSHFSQILFWCTHCASWLQSPFLCFLVLVGWKCFLAGCCFFCGLFGGICGDAWVQASIAAFLCLKTRARRESGTNPLIWLELLTLLHKHVALVSGANSFVQHFARWSSPFVKSCAMTDSMAMDLSTGVGQHRYIKGRLASAYSAWTAAYTCSPARASFFALMALQVFHLDRQLSALLVLKAPCTFYRIPRPCFMTLSGALCVGTRIFGMSEVLQNVSLKVR